VIEGCLDFEKDFLKFRLHLPKGRLFCPSRFETGIPGELEEGKDFTKFALTRRSGELYLGSLLMTEAPAFGGVVLIVFWDFKLTQFCPG
jgi:hypothetical protein